MKLTQEMSQDEKKMIRQLFWRSQTLYCAVSPAKMGGAGYCYSMMPVIDRLYEEGDPRKKDALMRQIAYFNITIPFSTFVMGISASMEKENKEKPDFDESSINAIKLSLMGPLSGIGDSLFWGVWRVIAAGIAVGLAQAGNVLAPIIFLALFNIPTILIRYYGGFLGYSLGSQYITKLYSEGLIGILSKAASIVGLTMVGAMTSQMVKFETALSFSMEGETIMKLQEVLDQIFIGLVPILLTLLFFKLLKKNVSVNILILGCIILGILLKATGVC